MRARQRKVLAEFYPRDCRDAHVEREIELAATRSGIGSTQFFVISPDLAVTIFGAYSLMVLAINKER